MFDNGKIRVSLLGSIPLIEVYHDGELELDDLEWLHHVIFRELPITLHPPIDIIVDKTGNYSVSIGALDRLEALMKDVDRVAYVVYSPLQEKMVEMMSGTYMTANRVASFSSADDACAWIRQEVPEQQAA